MTIDSIVENWKEAVEDPTYKSVIAWKAKTGLKAAACFPVYTPMELIYASGLLPVSITGAGNRLEISNADSRFGSFICSIAKSTMEQGLRGYLRIFDAVFFHSICDTARNLAFLFKRNFTNEFSVEYVHFPQNLTSDGAIDYYEAELRRLLEKLEEISGRKVTEEDLTASLRVYNENRDLLRQLYEIRAEAPQLLSTPELYILMKAGNFLPPPEHTQILSDAINDVALRSAKSQDKVRVVLEGSFCEQPPIDLLAAMEQAGCYIVEDDLLIGRRWYYEEIPVNGNPLRSLAESYLKRAVYSSVRHDWRNKRMEGLLRKVKSRRADAVVFCIAKFCEPAFFDYVLFKEALESENIPHLLVEFEEKMWTFEKARTEMETFVESILFD